MALYAIHNETKFGVGDVVRIHQRVFDAAKEKGEQKSRIQVFEGMVIKIKGRDDSKSFTVRRIGAQKIGIEQIYPLNTPILEKIEVSRQGTQGSRRAKLYYTRDKSKKEIELIYSRTKRRIDAKAKANSPKSSPKKSK